jgi:hypothetical protein
MSRAEHHSSHLLLRHFSVLAAWTAPFLAKLSTSNSDAFDLPYERNQMAPLRTAGFIPTFAQATASLKKSAHFFFFFFFFANAQHPQMALTDDSEA